MFKSFKILSPLFNKITLATFMGSFSLICYNKVLANDEMKFSWHKNCEDCDYYILAEGRIGEDTPQKFLNFLSSADVNKTVYFNSVGGSLNGGLALGEIIRNRRMNTYLGNMYKEYKFNQEDQVIVSNPVCYSACAYAFLGGVKRKVEDDAKYGIHYFRNTNSQNSFFQKRLVDNHIYEYLDKMQISRDYLNLAKSFKGDEMHIVPDFSRKFLNIDNTGVRERDWLLSSLNTIVNTKNVEKGSVNMIIKKEADTYIMTYNYSLTNMANLPKSINEQFNSNNLFNVEIDGVDFLLVPEKDWRKIRSHTYQIKFKVNKNMLLAFTKAQRIKFYPKTNNKFIYHEVYLSKDNIHNLIKFLEEE